MHELVYVLDAVGAHEELEVGEMQSHELDDLVCALLFIDGQEHEARFGSPGGAQQIETPRITIEHLVAETPKRIDLFGIEVEDGDGDTVCSHETAHDVAEATEAGDNDRVFLVDVISLSIAAGAGESGLNNLVVNDHEQRRQRHERATTATSGLATSGDSTWF
jgi:polygalacturonase